MTKFNDDFIKDVKSYWEDNKGKIKYVEKSGVHMERTTKKSSGYRTWQIILKLPNHRQDELFM